MAKPRQTQRGGGPFSKTKKGKRVINPNSPGWTYGPSRGGWTYAGSSSTVREGTSSNRYRKPVSKKRTTPRRKK